MQTLLRVTSFLGDYTLDTPLIPAVITSKVHIVYDNHQANCEILGQARPPNYPCCKVQRLNYFLPTSLPLQALGAPLGAALLTHLNTRVVLAVMGAVLLLVIALHCKAFPTIARWVCHCYGHCGHLCQIRYGAMGIAHCWRCTLNWKRWLEALFSACGGQ